MERNLLGFIAVRSLASLSQAEWWAVDVAYESLSGDAVLVWANGTAGPQPLSYAVWNGSSWTGPSSITTPLSSEAWQIDWQPIPARTRWFCR